MAQSAAFLIGPKTRAYNRGTIQWSRLTCPKSDMRSWRALKSQPEAENQHFCLIVDKLGPEVSVVFGCR
jgi:hypothetical protein